MIEHLDIRDTWADEGIWIVKPKHGKAETADGPTDQASLIAMSMNDICEKTGANLVIWDTITGSARSILAEQSELRSKQSAAKTIQHKSKVGANYYVPPREARFIVQDHLRLGVRDQMLHGVTKPDGSLESRKYHLVHVAHQETAKKSAGKDSSGEAIYAPVAHGANAGGPASAELYGTEWQAVHRLWVDKDGKRKLQTNQYADRNGVPFLCQTRTGKKKLPDDIALPLDDFASNLKVAQAIVDNWGIDLSNPAKHGYFSMLLIGMAASGKTRWVSTFKALEGITGVVYVAADGDSEYIRSFWDEVKQAKENK